MKIRKCKKNDVNEVYDLICELEETKLNYEEFKTALYNKIDSNFWLKPTPENQKTYYSFPRRKFSE